MDRKITNPWKWQDQFGFVQGHEVSGAESTLYCAGQVSVDTDGNVLHPGDMAKQVAQVLDQMETLLTAAGYSFADIVRLNYYTTDVPTFIESMQIVGPRLAAAKCQPSSTLLGVTSLFHPDVVVEMEVTAVK